MARVEDVPSEEEDEPEVIIEDDATEQEEIDNESEASDDLSETEEAESALETRIAELEQQIAEDPYQYDLHVQLIDNLDKLSDLDRMRSAFERLHGLYTLKPEQWLLWTRTEAAVAHTREERDALHNMFIKATNEVYSMALYTEWLGFSMMGNPTEARTTYNVILRRAGYDPTASNDIWNAVVQFEQSNLTEVREEELEEQVVRTARCLAEQLTRPLPDAGSARKLQDLHTQHASAIRQGYLETVLKQSQQIEGVREKINTFEDRLLTAEPEEKVEIYREYFDELKDLHYEDRDDESPFSYLELLAALYDRAIYECLNCDNVDVLLASYSRLASRLTADEGARALEVCVVRRPLVAGYWILLMQHQERQKKPFTEIQSVLERALSSQQMSQAESEKLWLGYLESLRRYTDMTDEQHKEKLRSNMRYILSTVDTLYGADADADCTIAMWWARLEYERLGDPARGREIFEENIFQNDYKKGLCGSWLALLELELGRSPRPPEKKLRELFKRSVKFTADYPPSVCDRWIAFERDYGTLDSLLQCKETCKEALDRWKQKFEADKEAKQNAKKGKNKNKKAQNRKSEEKQSNSERNAGTDSPKNKSKGKKRPAESETGAEGAKKKKEDVEVKRNGVKRSHGDTEDSGVDNKRVRTSNAGGGGGGGGDSAAMPPPNTQQDSSAQPAPGKEACTLFVSNLDFKFNETALRQRLSEWGTITALRFVRGVKAFGGAICYCEYTTPEAVDVAVTHDRTPLDERPLFLSRYRTDKQKSKFKYATVPERNKLFVRNLPFSCCTRQRLTELFEKHGELRDVRIVAYKDGRPKGLAYIEYVDEKAAAAALQATDNLLLEERHLQVAFSAPPARDIPPAASLGQARRDTNAPRRTQLSSLLPRVLQKPTAAPSPAPSGSSSTPSSSAPSTTTKTMSNSDFRNMLLNKK